MASSRQPHFHRDPFQRPSITPGPLGHNDAASPNAPNTLVGDTPGPLGINDHADPSLLLDTYRSFDRRRVRTITISQDGLKFIWNEEYRKHVSEYLHWPGGASGVTIGPGYDLKCRTKEKVVADLTTIGINPNTARLVAQGAGRKGEEARVFVRSHHDLPVITEEMGVNLLQLVITEYESLVKALVKVPLRQHEYDALVSFAYNPGGRLKRVARRINEGDVDGAMKEIAAANTSNGQVLPGLLKRRQHEVELFKTGRYK